MRRTAPLPSLLALLAVASPVAAQQGPLPPKVAGLWTGQPPVRLHLAKAPQGTSYGGIVRKGGKLHHLTLERAGGAWRLVVREELDRSARGAAGALAGLPPRATWAWDAPRAVALTDTGATLAGGPFRLQDPLAPNAPAPEAKAVEAETLVIGHRGAPTVHCENTLPALQAALAQGATGLEIDLCLTRDGEVVLWHDAAPNELVALVRNHGFEGEMAYMPNFPALGSPFRKPVHELDLADLRAHFGYSERRFTLEALDPDPGITIPTLAEVAPFLAQAQELRRLILDVKLPADAPELQAPFTHAVLEVLDRHGLTERSLFLHADAEVLAGIKAAARGRVGASHDVEIKRLFPGGDAEDYSAVAAAEAMGNRFASVGRPRLMLWGGWDFYLEVLRHDLRRIEAERPDLELIVWTLNDPAELREVLELGVDGVLTDHPGRLARMIAARRPATAARGGVVDGALGEPEAR